MEMMILEIVLWVGFALCVAGTTLPMITREVYYGLFLVLGGIIILIVCMIALYDFGQLPLTFEWIKKSIIEMIGRI